MKRSLKKKLSVLIAVIIVFGMIPSVQMGVYAEAVTEDETVSETADLTVTENSGVSDEDIVTEETADEAAASIDPVFSAQEPEDTADPAIGETVYGDESPAEDAVPSEAAADESEKETISEEQDPEGIEETVREEETEYNIGEGEEAEEPVEDFSGEDESLDGLTALTDKTEDTVPETEVPSGEDGSVDQDDVLSEDSVTPEEIAFPAFSQSASVDGVTITVSADEGVFTEGAYLSVESVPVSAAGMIDAAVDNARDADATVVVSYVFDIKVLDAEGNEIQPADEQSVKVSFSLAEASDRNLDAAVYHVADDGAAEALETSRDGNTIEADTDSFSYYTVEFTYGTLKYVLPGDGTVELSTILNVLGLSGEVTDVQSSAPELFSAESTDGIWKVILHQSFTTSETLTVTINSIDYVIKVTDPEKYNIWVSGIQVTSENLADVLGDRTGSVKFNPSTNTLTLNDPVITGVKETQKAQIYSDNIDLTINGNADLTYENAEEGIWVNRGQLTITGGTITAKGNWCGIVASWNDIKITGGTIIAIGGSTYSESTRGAISAAGGNIIIEGGNITATGEISGIEVVGAESVGKKGSITITGGTVKATGKTDYGIAASSDIVISGENTMVTAEAERLAMVAETTIQISDPLGIVTPVSGMVKGRTITRADGETVAKAVVIRKAWMVSFEMNGHGPSILPQYVADGSRMTEPADISAEGCTFDGWYTDAACTNQYDFNTPVTKAFTLYAKWLVDPIVTFDVQGHGTAPETQQINYGGTAAEPSKPSAEGYTFDGWYTEAACTNKYDFSTPITEDITLYAKWLADPKVTFDVQGHGTAPETQTLAYGGTATEPSKPAAEGYTFGGWYTEAACATAYDFSTPVTMDITLYAKWMVNVDGLKMHSDGGNIASSGNYYLSFDQLEPVFEKNTESVDVTYTQLYTDEACSSSLTAEPEQGVTYYFRVSMKDPSSYDSGIQLVMFLPEIANNIDASAEEASIEYMWISGSPNGDSVVVQFKYTRQVIEYTVTKGGDSVWTKGSSSGADYKINRNINDDKTYSLFESIEVDGAVIAASNYDAASGSLDAALKASYLETLSEGTHTVQFNFRDGSVATKLTVNKAPETPTPDVPRTGDTTDSGIWFGTMLMSMICLVWLIIYRRKSME